MPYESIEAADTADFPILAEGVNLTLEQVNALSTLHDTVKADDTIKNPMSTAWTKWLDMYQKVDEKWVTIESQAQKATSHDAILQSLNREIDGYCFKTKAFEDSVSAWDGIPMVYAPQHPDMYAFSADPAKALADIGGRIVGEISKPHIALDGHPRLMGQLLNKDPEVDELINSGKASISTGFLGRANAEKHMTEIVPNHILVFREDPDNMPKDHGAFILNSGSYIRFANMGELVNHSHRDDKNKSEIKYMDEVTKLTDQLNLANKEIGDTTSKLGIANKEIEDLTAAGVEKDETITAVNKVADDLKTTLEARDVQIKEFEQKEADSLVAKRDAQWEAVKASLPVGLTHKEDEAKVLREQWETDPHGFSAEFIQMGQKAPAKGESGGPGDSGQSEGSNTSGVYTPGVGYKEEK